MISIIGAGPAGSYLAYLLANTGKKVQIFEEHKTIGNPVQCTGIVTSEFQEIMEPKKEFTINQTNKARIFSLSGKCIDLKLGKDNHILDRYKFDSYLADKAQKAGAEFFPESKFISGNKDFFIIKQKDKLKKIKKEILIGADGPLSSVAKSYGMYGKRKLVLGFQYRAYMGNDNAIEFYPGRGIYSWIVPESKNIVRIGIGDYISKGIKKQFDEFLKFKQIKKKDIIEAQAGLIPMYSIPNKIQKNNAFLIGDAACQVKATTGGGIVPGLIAAKALSKAIIENKSYYQLTRKLRKELIIHMLARRIMDNFSKNDWDFLFRLFENKKNMEILETIEREKISKIAVPLLRNDPRFLYFAKNLFF